MLKSDLSDADKKATLTAFDQIFGLGLAQWEPKALEIPAEIQQLADQRQAARAAKDWAEADRLRAALQEKGWVVEDKAGSINIRRI